MIEAPPVNSYTEWGPLEEVVVGDHSCAYVPRVDQNPELSFRLFFHDNLYRADDPNFFRDVFATLLYSDEVTPDDVHLVSRQYVEEREEDVDGFVRTLERCGVTVRRPTRLERLDRTSNGSWSNLTSPAYNVRDQVLVVGDEIIETPPLCRNRYFENDLLKPLFMDYFRRGARWTVAPRPTMRNCSFDRSYVGEENAPGGDLEIMFDAAQCLRFGRDILFNVANENHRLGFAWLSRHLGERARVHMLDRLSDNHIDSMMMPLRPGTLLVHPYKMKTRAELLPEPLRRWDTITCEDLDESVYSKEEILLASRAISVNVLSVDEERVIVNESCPGLIRALEAAGFVVIPVRLRHSRLFGGGFHCITLDVRRRETLESYW